MPGLRFLAGSSGNTRNCRDDFFSRGFADGARGIPDTALRQSVFAAAGAAVRVETVEGDFLLFGREFRKVDAGKLGGAVGMFEENLASVLEGFHFCLNGKTEQCANFRFVELGIEESDVLLNDAAFGIQNEGGGKGGDASVFLADFVGSDGDGIVDAGIGDVLLNFGGVVVVNVEADDLETVLVMRLKVDEVGNFGATRSAPSGPKIQEDDFATSGFEGEGLAIERSELEIGCGIGIANETDYGLGVLLRERRRDRDERKQRRNEPEEGGPLVGKLWSLWAHGVLSRRAHWEACAKWLVETVTGEAD